MKFEAKNLSPVAFHALICVEVSVSIKCFDWSKMAAEVFPVARIDEYAKPCEPAIHVLRSVPLERASGEYILKFYHNKNVTNDPDFEGSLFSL